MPERLSRDEINLLKYLNSIDGLLDVATRYSTRESLASKLQISKIDDVLNHLLELDFLEKKKNLGNSFYYAATTKSRNILEFIRTEKKEKLIWSITIPAIITLTMNLVIYFGNK
jgi:hypothetical protein